MSRYYIENKRNNISDEIVKRVSCYKELFLSTDLGRDVLSDILNECMIEKRAFCKDSNEQTHINLGKQEIGHHILNMISLNLMEIKENA